ncbi:MAG: enoyl-CoA hydratase-related protein [Dehalococcoidia bacterium]|nr:enoyl-CoA hydratase-related protein [Dehalococcoidia bacterium]
MLVLYEKKDKVAIITLNRPEAFNSINPDLLQEISNIQIKFRDDPDVLVGIVTGSGKKAFCAGADIKTMIPRLADKLYVQPSTTMRGLDIWKPLIAAVNGMALGGGMELAMSCDIRIAAENAVFGQPEVKWSFIPGWGGTQRLPRLVPSARAAELLLMGNNIDANEAYRIGLVNKVVPQDQLLSTALEWAAKICENGPMAVRAAKEAMMRGLNTNLEDGLYVEKYLFDYALSTKDAAEGSAAFLEKRKPQYKGT